MLCMTLRDCHAEHDLQEGSTAVLILAPSAAHLDTGDRCLLLRKSCVCGRYFRGAKGDYQKIATKRMTYCLG